MRVIVAGSRRIEDSDMVFDCIRNSGFNVTEIVSGTAAGVDTIGEIYGIEYAIDIKRFPPDWKKYGKAAGPLRNMDMAIYTEAAVIVWDGQSAGTRNLIENLESQHKEYALFNERGQRCDYVDGKLMIISTLGEMNDQELIDHLESFILDRVGGLNKFRRELPKLISKAITFVIDTKHTGRMTLKEIEKTEKTYIGTRVELQLRNYLMKVPKGKHDMVLGGIDVDTKFTCTRGNWMIPPENFGVPCLLIASSEKTKKCRVGLFIAHEANLSVSRNRDAKRQVSKEGRKHIKWIFFDEPLIGKRYGS